MKRVLFTKEQLEECMLNDLRETKNYMAQGDGTEPLDAVMTKAQAQYMPQNGDTISVNANQTADGKQFDDNDTITRQFESVSYSKKQIKEAKLKYLKENSYPIRKKDLK